LHIWRFFLLICLLISTPMSLHAVSPLDSGSEVSGYVWNDWDQDGHRDDDEQGLEGVRIDLVSADGTVQEQTCTDQAGEYSFTDLIPGSYVLSETDPFGFTSTTPNVFSIELGEQDVVIRNFGDALVLPGCFHMVSGIVWHDEDGDGQLGDSEQALPGAVVQVLDLEHNAIAAEESDGSGSYEIRDLAPAQYHVMLDPPGDTPASEGPLHWGVDLRGCHPALIDFGLHAREEGASMLDWAERHDDSTHVEDLAPLALQGNSCISGTIWCVEGSPLGGRALRRAAAGVKVTLANEQGQIIEAKQSDAAGHYCFDGLGWQRYHLIQEPIPGYEPQYASFWGAVVTDECEIAIDFENLTLSEQGTWRVYCPVVSLRH